MTAHVAFALVLLCGGALGAPAQLARSGSGLRLLEFGEKGPYKWATPDEVDELVAAGKGFFDVTDTMNGTYFAADTKEFAIFSDFPPAPTHQDYVNGVIETLSQSNIKETIEMLSAERTRYYTTQTAVDAVHNLKEKYEEYRGDRRDVAIEIFDHSWLQPSLIVTVPGSGPHASEIVVLGGHIDSINSGARGVAPGSDDDASGSACVLETFRTLMDAGFKPDRTIEFHAYAAEEVGLRGSQDIALLYQREGRNVVSMMQLDMTCWPFPEISDKPQIGLIGDYVSTPLTAFVHKLVDAYCTIPATDSKCGYACSDHASWTKAGFPSAFPFESIFEHKNTHIHTDQDTLKYCLMDHAIEFARLAVGYTVEMGIVD